MKKETIGILGGMGPEASSYFYKLLIELAHTKYGAVQDAEFPPTIIYNLPLDDFDERGIVDANSVCMQLIEGVQLLERAGSDFIIIACNTVHAFHESMQKEVAIPILNIVEETVRAAVDVGYESVGIVGSETTSELGLYADACVAAEVNPILVSQSQQAELNDIILHVMAGRQDENDSAQLACIVESLAEQGAEAIILGCTELPLAIEEKYIPIPLLNSNQIILNAALQRSLGFGLSTPTTQSQE